MSRNLTFAGAAAGAALAMTLATTPAWAPPPPGPPPGGGKGDPLERVIFISGNDTAADNGAALLAEVGDIGIDGPCSSPAPSASAPCLIKLGPGVYDISPDQLAMVDHVDIEGSGEGVTAITGATSNLSTGLVLGADAELRHLTVENTRSNNAIVEVRAILTGGSDMRISHVTAIANGSGNTAGAGNVGVAVLGTGGAPILTHVTASVGSASVTPRAIVVGGGATPMLDSVKANSSHTALGLVGSDAETVTVRNSHLSGAVFSITAPNLGTKVVNIHASQLQGILSADGAGSTVGLATSQLDGLASETNGGVIDCVFVYTSGFVPHGC